MDFHGNRWDVISVVLAPLKCLDTTLLLSSDSSQPLISFTKESPSITFTGSLFCVLFLFLYVRLFHMLSFNHFVFDCHWLSHFSQKYVLLGANSLVTMTSSFLSDMSWSLRDLFLFDRVNLGLDWLWDFLLQAFCFGNWWSSSASLGVKGTLMQIWKSTNIFVFIWK